VGIPSFNPLRFRVSATTCKKCELDSCVDQLKRLRINYLRCLGRGIERISREHLPVVEHALRERLAAGVAAQIRSEA